MPRQAPPEKFSGTPAICTLPAAPLSPGPSQQVRRNRLQSGCFRRPLWWRPFRLDRARPVRLFVCGESDATAIAEALLRDVEANDGGYRFLPKQVWGGRELSRIETTVDVELVCSSDWSGPRSDRHRHMAHDVGRGPVPADPGVGPMASRDISFCRRHRVALQA